MNGSALRRPLEFTLDQVGRHLGYGHDNRVEEILLRQRPQVIQRAVIAGGEGDPGPQQAPDGRRADGSAHSSGRRLEIRLALFR